MAAPTEFQIVKWVCSATFGKVDNGFNWLRIQNDELS